MLTVADPGETHIKEIYNGRKSTYSIYLRQKKEQWFHSQYLSPNLQHILMVSVFMNNNNNNNLQQSNKIFYTKP